MRLYTPLEFEVGDVYLESYPYAQPFLVLSKPVIVGKLYTSALILRLDLSSAPYKTMMSRNGVFKKL